MHEVGKKHRKEPSKENNLEASKEKLNKETKKTCIYVRKSISIYEIQYQSFIWEFLPLRL